MTKTYINTDGVLVYYLVYGSTLEAKVNAYNFSQSQQDYDAISTAIKWATLDVGQKLATGLDYIEVFQDKESLLERVNELVFAEYFEDNTSI